MEAFAALAARANGGDGLQPADRNASLSFFLEQCATVGIIDSTAQRAVNKNVRVTDNLVVSFSGLPHRHITVHRLRATRKRWCACICP